LAKWKLFHRSKGKEELPGKVETTSEYIEKREEKKLDLPSGQESTPIKEYNETLFSMDSSLKPAKKYSGEGKEPLKRTSWENPRTIEQNIDTMKKTHSEASGIDSRKDIDVDRKVDQILLKKKMKI
jgi:hypothetical protein